MIGNRRPSEVFAVVSTVDAAATTTARTGDWVDAGAWESLAFVMNAGTVASDSTVDFKLEQATDSSGTGAKDLVVATQRAAHATNNNGNVLVLECRTEELDLANNFRYVRPRIIGSGATGFPGCVIGLGFNARYNRGTNLADVKEIKQA